MTDLIRIWGIETNNLKNIDVSLAKHAINLIIGPSGSGKSSLAYDTIAQIGQHELMAMFADDVSEPTYKIKGYSDMLAAVPIKQSNFNNNMRSTIGTYFGINRGIAQIYAALLGLEESFFVLNKEGNLCEKCHGLGLIRKLDENRIVNYDVPIENNPIKCWNRYKDFYSLILKNFCDDQGIDSRKSFHDLSEHERCLILYGESDCKYSIRFRKNNALSRRTTKYHGVLTGEPMIVGFTPRGQYYSDVECPCCYGRKYAPLYEQYKLCGLSIGQLMTTSFSQLAPLLNALNEKTNDSEFRFTISGIQSFVDKAIEHNLGHLFFHRAIPTLSGGEFQRLRMVQVFNTQLTDLLIVLDEPLAGLSGSERDVVYKNTLALAKNHTVVVVDHSDSYASEAKQIIALGDKGGKDGGFLIDASRYLQEQRRKHEFHVVEPKLHCKVKLNTKVYMYEGVDISIAEDCMNLITGQSGVGKSTLLREYLPQRFEQYKYINQKPLTGNKNSSVATVLDIFAKITEEFAKKNGKDKRFFSNQTGCTGACPVCAGAGYLEYGYDLLSRTRLECKACNGTGFNKNLKKYELAGKTIFDIWSMTVDESIPYFAVVNPKIERILSDASSIMLGHLQIGQAAATLSGGENIRIKILKSMNSTDKVLGIDEPFKGLNNTEVYCVAKYLEYVRSKGKTIIVVDHTESAEQFFAERVNLTCHNGILTAK